MNTGRPPWRRPPAGGHSFVADLRMVLAERNFRRLFATRLISQSGDGMFTAGLGAYVFFNATSFPNPGAEAAAGHGGRSWSGRRCCGPSSWR